MDWVKDHWYVVLLIIVAIIVLIIVIVHFIVFLAAIYDEHWLKKYERKQELAKRKLEMRQTNEDKALEVLAKQVCSKIGRAEVSIVINLQVHIDITAQSGNSQWKCIIDFNDNGKLTGNYKLYSENDRSTIPAKIAERIKEGIVSA